MAAGKNQVTLTFAGDHDKLTRSFDAVGASAKNMSTDVGSASGKIRDTGDSFDRAGEAADSMDTKAMGFRDTMTGVEDTSLGVSKIMKGELFDGFLTLGMGIGDLGSGLYNFLIPAIKNASLSMVGNAVATTKATVASGVHKVATLAGAAATTVMTVAQKALNLAMRANPIGLIITALVLVGTALVAAYKKSETFRNIVQGVFRAVAGVAKWFWTNFIAGAKRIGTAMAAVGRAISAPFRAAFNAIRSFWNSTIGGKGFSIPDWVPIIGGKTFRIPRLHTGGVVPGAPGSETMAILQAGEKVTPAGQSSTTVIELRSSGSRLDDLLLEVLRNSIRVKGGNVQVVLGQ